MKPSAVIVIVALPTAASFAPSQREKPTIPTCRINPSSSSMRSAEDPNSEYAQFMTSLLQATRMPGQTQLQPFRSPFALARPGRNDWREWHWSFGANGYTDFLPQFMDSCDCMAIDVDGAAGARGMPSTGAVIEGARLPWQHGDGGPDGDGDSIATTTSTITSVAVSPGCGLDLTASAGGAAAYDCILDGGVLGGMVSSLPPTAAWHPGTGPRALLDLATLVGEAARAIRGYGIYVAITDREMPGHARGCLDGMGDAMGMEWKYDLDGLSRDGFHVSVARKHYAGAVDFDPSSFTVSDDEKNALKP